jgi:Kef-type K+ transport system membrane component KefB
MEQALLSVILQLTFIIVTARIFATLFKRLGQPGVCGEMGAGLIFGPSLFGKFFPHLFQHIFNPSVSLVFTMFSQVGLVLLLFLLGMNFEFHYLRSHGRKALIVAVFGMATPFALALLLARALFPLAAQGTSFTAFSLFVATALSITALPILGIILVEFNLNRTEFGVIAITSAALMDVAGWIALATVNAVVRSGSQPWLAARMLLEVVAFAAFMVLVARPLAKRWVRGVLRTERDQISVATLAIVLALVFVSSLVTSLIGIFAIFGGFIMGAILFDEPEFRRLVSTRLEDFVRAFFVPIFFMYTGLRTDIGSMGGALVWKLCLLVIAVAIVSKAVPSMIAGRISGLSWNDSVSMGVLMNTRALMELIVLNIGYDLGVIPKSVFFIFVIMALTTTYMTAPLLRRAMAYATPAKSLMFAAEKAEEINVAG